MLIIGCDFHTRYQQVAALDTDTGETWERRVGHAHGEARAFYAALPRPVRVGMEATGHAQWFERMLDELGHELWVGDPAQIRAAAVRQQKTDVRDARHLLHLLASGSFPQIWVPSPGERDTRQLLLHRHKLVQQRSQVKHQLQALALSQGLCRGSGLWSQSGQQQLRALALGPWATRRRDDLLALLERLDPLIAELDQDLAQAVAQQPVALALQQQRGVGPVTALAYVLTLGTVQRFRRAKQVVSYLGLNPREYSSGGPQRLGRISKQGNTLLRWLLVEAGQSAARHDADLRRQYRRLAMRRGRNIAKIAVARKLAVRLYWRWRKLETTAAPPARTPGSPENSMVDAVSPSRF
jgi:transposase